MCFVLVHNSVFGAVLNQIENSVSIADFILFFIAIVVSLHLPIPVALLCMNDSWLVYLNSLSYCGRTPWLPPYFSVGKMSHERQLKPRFFLGSCPDQRLDLSTKTKRINDVRVTHSRAGPDAAALQAYTFKVSSIVHTMFGTAPAKHLHFHNWSFSAQRYS